MFSALFEHSQDSLWDQCARVLREFSPNASIEEVNRLVLLASHETKGDFISIIQEYAKDIVNEFTDKLPEAKITKKKGKVDANHGRKQRSN